MYSQMGQAELMLAVVMILYLIILLDPERALLTTNVQQPFKRSEGKKTAFY